MRDLIREKLQSPTAAAQTEEPLRGDFQLNPHLWPKSAADQIIQENRPLRAAAVLVPLVDHGDGMTMLLTKRTEHLREHAGQVAFPGGGREDHDASPVDTALRESEEEIGLKRQYVEILGTLDTYRTGTGYIITPVVGLVTPGFTLKVDPGEVAEAFEVPLTFLMNPDNHELRNMGPENGDRTYYAMPWNDYFIWGATAGMIVNLYKRLYT